MLVIVWCIIYTNVCDCVWSCSDCVKISNFLWFIHSEIWIGKSNYFRWHLLWSYTYRGLSRILFYPIQNHKLNGNRNFRLTYRFLYIYTYYYVCNVISYTFIHRYIIYWRFSVNRFLDSLLVFRIIYIDRYTESASAEAYLAKSNGVVFRGDKYLSPVLVLRVIDYATLRRWCFYIVHGRLPPSPLKPYFYHRQSASYQNQSCRYPSSIYFIHRTVTICIHMCVRISISTRTLIYNMTGNIAIFVTPGNCYYLQSSPPSLRPIVIYNFYPYTRSVKFLFFIFFATFRIVDTGTELLVVVGHASARIRPTAWVGCGAEGLRHSSAALESSRRRRVVQFRVTLVSGGAPHTRGPEFIYFTLLLLFFLFFSAAQHAYCM